MESERCIARSGATRKKYKTDTLLTLRFVFPRPYGEYVARGDQKSFA